MGRIRTIKPEAPQSENLGRVSRDARLLFFMLFTVADDEGRGRAAPEVLAGQLFPYDLDARTHIVEWLFELERESAVILYQRDGSAYFEILKWLQHQKIDRASASRLPAPTAQDRERVASPRESSMLYLVSSIVDQSITSDLQSDPSKPEPKPVRKRTPYPEAFETFWREYPTDALMSKQKAHDQWKRLDQTSQEAAQAAIPAFKDYIRKNTTYRPVHAQRFLSERRFDGFEKLILDPAAIEAAKDRADQLLRRGKYATDYRGVA
jgi:hypothetical protein